MRQKTYSPTFLTVTEIYNSFINEKEGLGEGINSDKINDKINTHISIIAMFGGKGVCS